jgi:Holliday junction resolvase RusA-like endonuclease
VTGGLLLRAHVVGRPKPQGSLRTLVPKGGGKPRTMHDAGVQDYRSLLASEIGEQWRKGGALDPAPVPYAVTAVVSFVYARPAAHYWPTNRNHGGELRHEAPAYPIAGGFGDVDKLCRMVGDALQLAAVLTDDRLIVGWTAGKCWSAEPDGPAGWTALALYRAAEGGQWR